MDYFGGKLGCNCIWWREIRGGSKGSTEIDWYAECGVCGCEGVGVEGR